MSLYEKLAEPFPDDVVLTNPKGMPYVPAAYVIDRLNRVLGVDGWSTRTDRVWYDEKADSVFATVTLTFHVENRDVQVTRTAGVPVKRYSSGDHAGEDVDMGDDFKSAETEALKKAAMDRGVGLYLAMKGALARGGARSGSQAGDPGNPSPPQQAPSVGGSGLLVKLTGDPSEREMKRRTGEVIGKVAEVQGVLPTGEKVRVSAYRDLIPTLMGLRAGQSIVLTGFAEKSPYNGVRQIDATAFTVVADPAPAPPGPPVEAEKRQRTVDMALTVSGPSKSRKVLQGTQEVQAIVRGAAAGVNDYLPENAPVSVGAMKELGVKLGRLPDGTLVYVHGTLVEVPGKTPVLWADAIKTVDELVPDTDDEEEPELPSFAG